MPWDIKKLVGGQRRAGQGGPRRQTVRPNGHIGHFLFTAVSFLTLGHTPAIFSGNRFYLWKANWSLIFPLVYCLPFLSAFNVHGAVSNCLVIG